MFTGINGYNMGKTEYYINGVKVDKSQYKLHKALASGNNIKTLKVVEKTRNGKA